jgi:hypothetical protein
MGFMSSLSLVRAGIRVQLVSIRLHVSRRAIGRFFPCRVEALPVLIHASPAREMCFHSSKKERTTNRFFERILSVVTEVLLHLVLNPASLRLFVLPARG